MGSIDHESIVESESSSRGLEQHDRHRCHDTYSMKWLCIILVILFSPGAFAQGKYDCADLGLAQSCLSSNNVAGLLNIRMFGAKGDGVTDDTAAIQKAIDTAYANNDSGVFCPSGQYKTTSPLYLDPPGNLRSNLSNPTMFNFSLAFVGQDESMGTGYEINWGCQIQASFTNGPALYVGTGQHMRVANIGLVCEPCTYHGNIPSTAVGIALTGGDGGSSVNLIENVNADYFYADFKTDANGGCCLDDSVTFRKVVATDAYAGIDIFGQQSASIRVDDCTCAFNAISIWNQSNIEGVVVSGGNLSNEYGASNSFGIASVSSLSKSNNSGFPYPSNGNGANWYLFTFTATIASPDQYVPNVYNSWVMSTPGFGLVPMIMTAWNSGTDQATFELWAPWVYATFGTQIDLTAGTTDLQSELQNVSTIYAAERVTALLGGTIKATGITLEEQGACFTIADTSESQISGNAPAASAGGNSIWVENSIFGNTGNTGASNPIFYCQQAFPLIYQPVAGVIDFENNTFGEQALSNDAGIIDLASFGVLPNSTSPERGVFIAKNNRRWYNPNVRYSAGSRDGSWNSVSITNGYFDDYSSGHGAGYWDPTPFLPRQPSGSFPPFVNQTLYARDGEMATPYIGWRPDPSRTPNLPPTLYSSVSGSLGALGTYPVINCETVYKSVDWNSTALAHVWARSASCPMFSYGQNLTNALLSGTITWSYDGQSNVVKLDATTLSWMFAGLAIGLPDPSSGTDWYIVTGVYPTLGYITVVNADSDTNNYGLLVGTAGTTYSCSSSCSISEKSYSWTQY